MADTGAMGDGAHSMELSEDAFLGGQVMALQPRRGYRAGIDAVLLAAAAQLEAGPQASLREASLREASRHAASRRVLDAGAGVGVAGLCLAARVADAHITMVEIAGDVARLARENVLRNGWSERIEVINADLTAPIADLEALGVQREHFDHVLANPPFHIEGEGTRARGALKAGAHAMASGGLERWARFMATVAKPGGTMTIIHRAERLPELLAALRGRFGALRVLPIHPRQDEPAMRVIVAGTKGSFAPLRLLPGFILHGPGNGFLPQAEAILRHGEPLPLA